MEGVHRKIASADAHAAHIIEEATIEFRSLAPGWSYTQQFDTLHDHARELAREFYLRYPDDGQALEFNRRYIVKYERDREKTANPMRCDTNTLEIFLFFSLRHLFEDYAACLFLFLHEYTAHIYAENRTKNVLFQDGWMMYAAADFLYKKWLASDQLPPYAYECHFAGCPRPLTSPPVSSLDLAQVEVDDYLRACCTDRHGNERHEWRVFKTIRNFDVYLEDAAYFAQLTRQLAWFRPGEGETPKFQTRFVNLLHREFESGSRSALRTFARQHPDVRALMNYLEQTETNKRAQQLMGRDFRGL